MSAIIPPVHHDEIAYLGLGSNLGDRLASLQAAVEALHADPRTTVLAVSSVYQTAPVGGPEQEDFLNIAVRVATRRSPLKLLRLCQEVEATLGRERTVRWGPRTIDIDVLLYGPRTVATRSLEIPHPRLAERPFALIPLIEVAPGEALPDGTTLTAALTRLVPITGVTMVGTQVRTP